MAAVNLPRARGPVAAARGSQGIAVLGALLVGGDLPGSARQRRLLAILAVTAFEGRTVGRDELLDALYGDAGAANARRALATEVWRARQLLGNDALVAGPDGYRLDTHHVTVDLLEFRSQLTSGREALLHGEFAEAAVRLEAALALWRGKPLADWSDGRRARAVVAALEELRLGCTEDLAEALCGLDRYDDAAGLVQSVLEAAPQREHSWALLAECHLATGDRRRARVAFDTARRVLAEYGVEPGAELSAVRDLISGSAPEVRAIPRPAGLIGRGELLSELTEILGEALQASRTTLAVISGEAGIGKSAVVEHAVQALTETDPPHRIRVARAACDRRLTGPYAALDHLLAEFGAPAEVPSQPALGTSLGEHDSTRLALSVATILEEAAGATGGLVLVIEDAHWASAETLEMLRMLLMRGASVPLAVLMTVREPAAVSTDVRKALAELKRRAPFARTLEGLTVEATAQLLALEPARALEVHRLTAGNPLFLRNVTFLEEGGVIAAGTLDDALDEHIDSLPTESLPVLEVAAVIGRTFDLRVLITAVAHEPLRLDAVAVEEAVAVAERVGLLHPAECAHQPSQRSFTHALVRDRLYARTPPRPRTEAHALVAQALRRRTDADKPDLLAHHSREGWPTCPTGDVVAALRLAGDATYRQLGFTEALNYYDEALDVILMDPAFDDRQERRLLLADAGRAATAADDPARARAVYAALHAHGQRYDEPATLIEGALGVVRTYFEERIDPDALTALDDALVALADLPQRPAEVSDALVVDAVSALALYLPERGRELLEQLSHSPQLRASLLSSTWAYESVAVGLRVTRELAAIPQADQLGAALRLWASEIASGQRTLEDAGDTWTLAGTPASQWESRLWRTMTMMVTGQFERARRLIDATDSDVARSRTLAEHTQRSNQLLGQRQFLALQSGDYETLVRLAGVMRPSMGTYRSTDRFYRALQLALAGDRDGAWARCDQLHDEFRAGLVPAQNLHTTLTGYLQTCMKIEHGPGLALSRDLLRPHVGEHILLFLNQYWGSVSHQVGKVASFFDDLDDAEENLRRGFEEHRQVGAVIYEVHSLRALSATLWHRGKRPEADRLHEECIAMATRIGMNAVAAHVWPPPRAFIGI